MGSPYRPPRKAAMRVGAARRGTTPDTRRLAGCEAPVPVPRPPGEDAVNSVNSVEPVEPEGHRPQRMKTLCAVSVWYVSPG
ncbi:hypothetical protein GCM10009837_29670 [Streptomyces durmitorensis]